MCPETPSPQQDSTGPDRDQTWAEEGRFDPGGPRWMVWDGARHLSDLELLELLLEPSLRTGARACAQDLVMAFGSFAEAVSAPLADLSRAAGAAPAVQLKAVCVAVQRLLAAPLRRRSTLGSWSQVLAYLKVVLAAEPREQFRVLFLDKKNQLIADEVMGLGTVDHAPVYPREVLRRALELHASALVLAHNHPSGDPRPSASDIAMTARIVAAARAIGLVVHDHIIIGSAEPFSLRAQDPELFQARSDGP